MQQQGIERKIKSLDWHNFLTRRGLFRKHFKENFINNFFFSNLFMDFLMFQASGASNSSRIDNENEKLAAIICFFIFFFFVLVYNLNFYLFIHYCNE